MASYCRILKGLSIYVDGLKDTTTTLTGDSLQIVYDTQGQRNFIGKNNHDEAPMHFNGNIDEVAIWRNALSASEINGYTTPVLTRCKNKFWQL